MKDYLAWLGQHALSLLAWSPVIISALVLLLALIVFSRRWWHSPMPLTNPKHGLGYKGTLYIVAANDKQAWRIYDRLRFNYGYPLGLEVIRITPAGMGSPQPTAATLQYSHDWDAKRRCFVSAGIFEVFSQPLMEWMRAEQVPVYVMSVGDVRKVSAQ